MSEGKEQELVGWIVEAKFEGKWVRKKHLYEDFIGPRGAWAAATWALESLNADDVRYRPIFVDPI